MSSREKSCFTCGTTITRKETNINNKDNDKVSYLEKLKACITPDLVETDEMYICSLCVRHLRVSYKFRLTVLNSQELLRQNAEPPDLPDLDAKREFVDFKRESGSDFESYKSDYSSDSDSDKPLKREKPESKAEPEPLTCEKCAAQFPKNWQLRKHLARVHDEHRKFVCSFCNKEFKQSYHLKEHITSHTGEKPYSCPICDKRFQRQSSRKRHIKTHDAPPGHKTKRTPFLCTICGKSFPFSNGVQRHMRIHLGIRKFECKLCERKFTQSTHLHVHMRTHTGEKPYICDTCGQKFSLKACMLKHISTRHERVSSVFVDDFPIIY